MKLCMVNGYFHPFVGGTEKHMYELGKRLARTEHVTVVTSRLEDTPGYELLDGMHVHRLPTRHYKMPLIYPPPLPVTRGVREMLARLDREEDFDAFNLHGRWFKSYNRAVDYAKGRGKPLVQTLHNARPVGISPSVTVFGTVYEVMRGKRVLASADRMISVSEALKRDIMEYGLDSEKITVIPNGVDTGFYKPSRPSFRELYGDGCENLLLFVGRIIQQKGLGHLLKAMPAVLRENPETRLLIVGKGRLRERLMRDARRLGLDRHVLFPGFVEDARMPELYSSADLFVLPSLWETFGFVLVEAAGCGVPLCGSDAGGIPEVIEDGLNGMVFPKGEPARMAERINAMLSDKPKLKAMGSAGRDVAVRRFDWEIIAGRTLGFYESFLAGARPPRYAP